jgi:maltooligosyltrehalose trehalohydrolase
LRASDPASPATLERCILQPELAESGRHAVLQRLYRHLLKLRAELVTDAPDEALALEARRVLLVRRGRRAWMAFCFSDTTQIITVPVPPGSWHRLVCSSDGEWDGPGSSLAAEIDSTGEVTLELRAHSFVVYGAVP